MPTAITGIFQQHPMNEPFKHKSNKTNHKLPKLPTMPKAPTDVNKLPQLDPMVVYKTPQKPKQLKIAIAGGGDGFPPLDPDKIFKKKLPARFLEKVKTLCKDNKFGADNLIKFFKRIR